MIAIFSTLFCGPVSGNRRSILQAHTRCRIGKVFSWLGLSVAAVTTEDRRFGDVAVRQEKFGADITYVTGQELAFTWMFDNTSSCRKPDQQVPLTLTLIYILVVGGLAKGSGGITQSNMHNASCPPNSVICRDVGMYK